MDTLAELDRFNLDPEVKLQLSTLMSSLLQQSHAQLAEKTSLLEQSANIIAEKRPRLRRSAMN